MTKFLLSVAEITVTMSVVILLIFLLFSVFGQQMKAKSRYIVLVLVLVRLAIPIGIPGMPTLFTIELSVPDQVSTDVQKNAVVVQTGSITAEHAPQASITAEAVETIGSAESVQPTQPTQSAEPVKPQEDGSLSQAYTFFLKYVKENRFEILEYAYLLIAAVGFFGALFAHAFYVHRIKKGRTLGEEKIYPLYAEVCRENGITNPPLLWVSRAADSPMIIGLITPRLILPENMKRNSLYGMLAHELKHYTRCDLWVKFVCMVARALHWFNPLVHIAAERCMQEMELSCDDEILARCDLEERRKYGNAMLDVVRNCQNKGVSLTTHFSPKKSSVKARFAGIMDMQNKKSGTWLIVLATALCIVSGTVLAYTLKMDVTAEEPFLNTYAGDGFTVTEHKTDDQTQVYWEVLLSDGQTFSCTPDSSVLYRPNWETIVSFEDVNFDEKQDLLICKGGYGAVGSMYYDCYLYSQDGYTFCESFSDIPNPVADAQKHVIISTYRQSGTESMTETYVYKDGVFSLQARSTTAADIVYFTDFSNPDVLKDFVAYRGTWVVSDGRLWLVSVDAENNTLAEMSALLLYTGDQWETLTNYHVDVDIYNVQTQTGVLTRCDLNRVSGASANSFYGYFHFVSKNGMQGALAYGCTHGNWGANLVVQEGNFAPGDDIHLCATVFGDELRCVYTDLETGEVLLDISCEFDYWDNGTFGFRILSRYEDLVGLGCTSFDNLQVKRLS